MENLEIILSIAGAALGLLVTTVAFLSKFIKNARAKRVAENLISIGNAMIPFIERAETFVNFSGEEKKQYVMTQANQFAIENGIAFDAEAVGDKIEELVNLSKRVNKRGTRARTAESVCSSGVI